MGRHTIPLIPLGKQIYAFFLIGKGILIEGIFVGMEREVRPVIKWSFNPWRSQLAFVWPLVSFFVELCLNSPYFLKQQSSEHSECLHHIYRWPLTGRSSFTAFIGNTAWHKNDPSGYDAAQQNRTGQHRNTKQHNVLMVVDPFKLVTHSLVWMAVFDVDRQLKKKE